MTEIIRRALIVEDDTSWQQILEEILSDLGLTVTIIDNLEEAVRTIRSTSFHLAVVDLSLDRSNHRNKDGLKILDAIQTYDPRCVSLLLTGYATVEIAVSTLTEYGALTCLRKETFVRSEFHDLVREALASSVPKAAHAAPHPDDASVTQDLPLSGPVLGAALVIEDDAGWRRLLSELLTEAGYNMRGCSGFSDALGYLSREQYDLAIVDLSLSKRTPPGMDREYDGYRLLASTRANGIPTIVVSGVADPQVVKHIYNEFNVYTYLEKQSFDRRIFLQTVQEIASSDQSTDELESLTNRERQVLSLLATGMTNQEIADTLIISTNTVKRHLKTIYKKLDTNNRAAAAARAIQAGLTPG